LFAPHLGDEMFDEPAIALPQMPLQEHVVEDYRAVGLSFEGASMHLLPRAADAARRDHQRRTPAREPATEQLRDGRSAWC